MISREEAETNPHRTILTSALGTNPDLVMDTPGQPEPLRPKDVLLICSDGLWGQVRDPEILAAVENKSVERAGRELIGLAPERGGADNTPVGILRPRWGGDPARNPLPPIRPPHPTRNTLSQHPPPSSPPP